MPQTPFGQVTAPAGVNIRSGPGTNFPAVGLAPFNTTLAITGRSADSQWWVTPIQGAPNNQGWVSASWVQTFNTSNVPVVPSPPPPPTATPAPRPRPPRWLRLPAQPQIGFWADRTTITQGECTTLRWQVHNVQAVFVYPVGQNFRDFPVTGEGSRQVCPPTTTTYEMRVQRTDGGVETRQVTINCHPGQSAGQHQLVVANVERQSVPGGRRADDLLLAGQHDDGQRRMQSVQRPVYHQRHSRSASGRWPPPAWRARTRMSTQEQAYCRRCNRPRPLNCRAIS